MITRHNEADGIHSRAIYSDCDGFRYLLTRQWADGGRLLYILLNPSTATEDRNDPTIERCQRRAVKLGYGAFSVANLFAYRATDPKDLKRAEHPIGPDNDAMIRRAVKEADTVLCGWGVHGAHLGRGAEVFANLSRDRIGLCHLGLTKGGAPRHPLYVSYETRIQPWIVLFEP